MGDCEASSEQPAETLWPPPISYVAPLTDGTTIAAPRDVSPKDPSTIDQRTIDRSPPIGRQGDYDLIEEIARGGMGIVYKAWQRNAGRFVALKMIRSGQIASRQEIARFKAEAEAAARLDHPGIVPIYQVGESDGVPFFSMALVDGTSLSSVVESGPLRNRDAARLVKSITDAIQYAHLRGVIHRDLKPSNVLIDRENRPRVTDFGLAKRIEDDSGLTLSGQVIGTPGYMPPEQARGDARLVGPESDVYALGAVLYFLLTGRPPFQEASVWDTIAQVLHRDPVSPRVLEPAIDADLETICLRCLQKSPATRYRSAGDLADELERYLRGEPVWARPVGPGARFLRWCRRNPKLAAATGTAVLGAAAAITGLSVGYYDASQMLKQNQRLFQVHELEKAGLDSRVDAAQEQVADLQEKLASAVTEAESLRKRVRDLESEPKPDRSATAPVDSR